MNTRARRGPHPAQAAVARLRDLAVSSAVMSAVPFLADWTYKIARLRKLPRVHDLVYQLAAELAVLKVEVAYVKRAVQNLG